MPDDAILNALSKRADLEARISKAEEVVRRSKVQIAEITRFIKQWEKFSGRSADDMQTAKILQTGPDLISGDASGDSSKNPKKEQVASEVIHILEKSGKPLSRTDLFKQLQERGVTINGANPEMVLSTMLWRTRDAFDIIRLKSGGYALSKMLQAGDEEDTTELDETDD